MSLVTGERVFLVRPTPDLVDEWIAVVGASRELHRGWVAPQPTVEGFEAWLAWCATDAFEGLLARERGTEAWVGVFNLSQIFRGGFQNAYLGFWANADKAGQGLMTEGLGLVVRWALTDFELHRLEANIQPANHRSKALVQRAGFRKEGFSPNYLMFDGEWKDHERWAITAEDLASEGR